MNVITHMKKMAQNSIIVMIILHISSLSQRNYLLIFAWKATFIILNKKKTIEKRQHVWKKDWWACLFSLQKKILSSLLVSIVAACAEYSFWSVLWVCVLILKRSHTWQNDSIKENWVIHPFFLSHKSICLWTRDGVTYQLNYTNRILTQVLYLPDT